MYRKINNQIGSYNTLLKPSKLRALDNLENDKEVESSKYILFNESQIDRQKDR